ncbi:MAG: serine/threonine protein kinase [Deltaproteobacteria bacterium]|nr:serine/threonine protein kinase [Deltaproteobacteria bacterium]
MEVISRYHLMERVGASGLAERYRAYEVTSGGLVRPVLLSRAREAAAVQALLDEGRLLATMHHPHVVRVVDVGHEGGQAWLVTDWVEGRPLATLLERVRGRSLAFDPLAALYIGMSALEALAHIHDRTDADGSLLEVVHTGVTPAAVTLGYGGEVVLGDLHQAQSRHRRGAGAGPREGALRYASPEQVQGREPDHRSDIFSAGLLLYELLSGRAAYPEANPDALRKRVERAQVEPLGDVARQLAPELVRVVSRALTFEPGQRYPSAHAFRDALAPHLFHADPTYGAHRLGALVSRLLADEAEEDRVKDQEARALLTTGGASSVDGTPPRVPAASEAMTLAGAGHYDPEPPAPAVSPVPNVVGPPPKTTMGGRVHEHTAELSAEERRRRPPPPPPASLAEPPPRELAQRHAKTAVPPPSLEERHIPIGKIALGLVAAALVSLLAFTFASDKNERLVMRKLRAAVVGRKPGATLTLESIPPGAKVFLDDQDTERTTPLTIENVESEDQHEIRLELSGEKAVTATIALVAGTKRTLNLMFPGAVVNLAVKTVPPGAELYLDERQVALTPATLTLRVGKPVNVELKLLGYLPWTQLVTPTRGEDVSLDVTLEKSAELIAQEALEKQALEEAAAEEAGGKAPAKKKPKRRRR